MTKYHRTYILKHHTNDAKIEQILPLLKEYQKFACVVAKFQWYLFFKNGKMYKNEPVKHLPSLLSARYKQVVQYQVVGQLESYIANSQNDFRRIVYCSNLDNEIKMKLYYINKYKSWFCNEVKIKKQYIEPEVLLLARKIIKRVFAKNNTPNFSNCNMVLNANVAIFEKPKNAQYDYWIKLSTLKQGKPIYIPLQSNSFFETANGKQCKSLQVNYNKETGEFKFGVVKENITTDDYVPETESIGLDLGLKYLFASNFGDLYGRKFYQTLVKYDNLISKLARNRQKQKLRVRSRKYDNLVSNVRSFVKNEICRVINNIVKTYKPKEIVVERLNFKNPHMSRRLNRIISNFGKSIISKKFESITEELGIKITEVNPAYTSQECSVCHCVTKQNRKTRDKFCCMNCNNTVHADVNAARNIFNRRSIKELANIYISKQNILSELRERFTRQHSLANTLMDELPW